MTVYAMHVMDTSMRLKESTRKRLEALGRKGESFDQLLNRMVDFIETEDFASQWVKVSK